MRQSLFGLAVLVLFGLSCHAGGNLRWDFLRSNLHVFPGTDKLFEPDPTLFWRLRANLRNVKAAEQLPDRRYPFSVSTNSAGRRLHGEVKNAKWKILFLGDSCTFGIPVNDAETFPSLVQQRLPRTQCINAGVPGYSAFQGRIALEHFSEHPQIAVISFWVNDRSVWDQLSDPEHAELAAAERAGEFSRFRLLRLLRRAGPSDRQRLDEREFAEQIRLLVNSCRARRIQPVLLIWPVQSQMAHTIMNPYQEVLRKLAREEKIASVDLVSIFRAQRSDSLFADGVHATREGYALVADTLARVLSELLDGGL